MTYQVGVDRAGLDLLERAAEGVGAVGDAVHRAVDDVVVERAVELADVAHERGRAVHDAVDDGAVEPGEEPA